MSSPRRSPAPGPAAATAAPTTPPPMYRQGDVLLVAEEALPDGAEPEPRGRRLVLAEGEVTGHAHVLDARDARSLVRDGVRYVLVRSRARLLHEEHAPIALPPGLYRVVIQREHVPQPASGKVHATPVQWRRVVD